MSEEPLTKTKVAEILLKEPEIRIVEKRVYPGGPYEGILINSDFENKDIVRETIIEALKLLVEKNVNSE